MATLRLDTNLDIVLGAAFLGNALCLVDLPINNSNYVWFQCGGELAGRGRRTANSSETPSQKRRINLHAKQNKLELVTRHFRGNIYVCLLNIINFLLPAG